MPELHLPSKAYVASCPLPLYTSLVRVSCHATTCYFSWTTTSQHQQNINLISSLCLCSETASAQPLNNVHGTTRRSSIDLQPDKNSAAKQRSQIKWYLTGPSLPSHIGHIQNCTHFISTDFTLPDHCTTPAQVFEKTHFTTCIPILVCNTSNLPYFAYFF